MTNLAFVAVGGVAWIGLMILLGDWLMRQRPPARHPADDDELRWIAAPLDPGRTETVPLWDIDSPSA